MDIIIQSLGFKASERLESYIREKMSKLSPSDHIIRANVTLSSGPEKATPTEFCEIHLEVPGNDHFVKEGAPSYEAAVVGAVDKMQRMIRKTKEKIIDSRQKPA